LHQAKVRKIFAVWGLNKSIGISKKINPMKKFIDKNFVEKQNKK
jgi:hypothetical protein